MKRFILVLLVLVLLLAVLPASAQSPVQLKLWRHETGDAEVNTNIEAIKRFNASQSDWEVVWETLPPGTYTQSITAASLAGDLPCVFDMDEPTVANFAWSGNLTALTPYLSPDLLADISTSGLGTYKDVVYSIGQFDVALTIFTRQSIMDKYNIRIPTVDQPWTLDEFNGILETLKNSGEFEHAIDVGAGGTGEWVPYAYSPMLQSFGGDLIDRTTYLSAEGVLNGDAALAWGNWYQSLFKDGYADPTPPDAEGFRQGRVAMQYTGSWDVGVDTDTFGDDLLFLPAVDFGHGPKIGGSSWQWGISANCANPDGAAAFINFIMQPSEVAALSDATSLIPTTGAAAALTENYAEGGKWRLFYEYSKNFAVTRPATPGYPIISSSFEHAGIAIRDGADVQNTLDDAVDAIDRNIADNNGYGFGQ